MPISREEVRKVAELARLQVPEEELSRLAEEMEKIVGYVESLAKIDTSGVIPQSQSISTGNVFRPDMVEAPLAKDEALRNAPKRDNDYFLVPRVIGSGS